MKCEFHVSSVSFLGYVVEKGQLRADPSKVEAVKESLPPGSNCSVFSGLLSSIDLFEIIAPLTQLASPKVSFVWSSTADSAFVKLILRSCCLLMPLFSSTQLPSSSLWSRLMPRIPGSRPSSPSASLRLLSPTEPNYDGSGSAGVVALAAQGAARGAAQGAAQPFIVWTDHKNVSYLRTADARFHFTLTYRPPPAAYPGEVLS